MSLEKLLRQGPIKPWTFSHCSQVIFKDWLLLPVMLCLSSKALYPWTTKQVSLRFTCSIFWELFWNSRTKCLHIQKTLNHKTIKRLRPWFFCVSTFPEIKEYKISVPWTFNKEIKKLLFLPSKMGVDLYTGSTYTWVNTVLVWCYFQYVSLKQTWLKVSVHLITKCALQLKNYGIVKTQNMHFKFGIKKKPKTMHALFYPCMCMHVFF